ncbi:MAG: tetratricopeptide repeat protein [Acidobacteriia bacterium]|nr:tetratricopeptide repeat protein [Terriglobia bacterium]
MLKNLAFCYFQRGPQGYAQAASYYSKAYELNPDSAEVVENLGRCLIGLNRAAEAATLFQQAAERPGAPAGAWKRAAEAYAAADRPRQAEQTYDAYLQRSPGDLEARSRLGDLYAREKDYAHAQEQYNFVLSSNPNYPSALIGLARLATWQGEHEEGLRLFDRVLRLEPKNGEALAGKAFALLWLSRYEEAQALFEDLHRRFPRDNEIARGLGQAQAGLEQKEIAAARRSGDTARLESLYRERLTKDPNDAVALRALAELTATASRCPETVDYNRKALALSPNDTGLELRLARALVMCQQDAEAIPHFQHVAAAEPNSQDALAELGAAMLRTRRTADAVEVFRKLLQVNPQRTDAKVGLALALAAEHRYEEALDRYNDALRTSPDNYDALQGKAFVLLWTGKLAEARAIFQSLAAKRADDKQNAQALDTIRRAEEEAKWTALRPASGASPETYLAYYDQRLAAYPDDVAALKGRAYTETQLKNETAAIQDYRKALELAPDDQSAKKELARLLAGRGQYDESIHLYREVLKDSPDDTSAQEDLARVYVWSHQDREALKAYQNLLTRDPANSTYQMEVARLQIRLQESAAARQSLNTVLAAESQNRDARLALAQLDDRQGDRASALRNYDAVLKQNPHDTSALLGKARISYYQGDAKQAYAAANDVVAAEPNNFDALFLLASIEHARGHRRQTKEFLDRAEQISPNNPEIVSMRQRLREERAITIHTTTSYAREIGPASSVTLGALPVSYIGIATDAAGNLALNQQGQPVPAVTQTAYPEITVSGLPNEDVRYETYGVTIGVPLFPKVDSYFSFTSLPTQSPTPSVQGAVAPWTFISRHTWHASRYLTIRGGVGFARFGPSDIQRSPDLTGNLSNLVDRFGPSVTNALGVGPTTVPGEAYKPIGLAGGTISPLKKLSIDLDWMHGPAVYYPTPRAMKLHLTQTRFDGGLNFFPTPRTELHFDFFYTRLFTDRNRETADFAFMDSAGLGQASTLYTVVVDTDHGASNPAKVQVGVPVPGPLFIPLIGPPDFPLADPPFLYYPSSGTASCPVVVPDAVGNTALQPTWIASTPYMLCAIGQVTTQTSRAVDWGHGGDITFNHNFVHSDRFSLDGGYRGTAYGFAGGRRNVFLGFFNPTFYQNHQLTGRIYGKLFGPVGYDWFGAFGTQQTGHGGALTRSFVVKPSFSVKVSPNLTLGIAYTHYNTAQVLGPLRGNAVSLTSDWKF